MQLIREGSDIDKAREKNLEHIERKRNPNKREIRTLRERHKSSSKQEHIRNSSS